MQKPSPGLKQALNNASYQQKLIQFVRLSLSMSIPVVSMNLAFLYIKITILSERKCDWFLTLVESFL